jgi:hypothetical protein
LPVPLSLAGRFCILYRVTATDPLTLGAVMVLLAIVMLAALLLPTHRAIKIEPIGALRHE